MVERFNRTLKEKDVSLFHGKEYQTIHRHFAGCRVRLYNNTRHSLIKMATADVTHDNEDVVRARLYTPMEV